MFLTGLVESTAIGMNGEERLVTKADLVRVYLSSTEEGQENQGDDKLTEYYLIIYKVRSSPSYVSPPILNEFSIKVI
jgi:5'-deoxynucleotidase YfbR-like HD superfamily hydrolase